MKKIKIVRGLAGVLLFSLGLAAGLTAQTLTDAPQRKEQKRTDLSGAPGMEVIASVVEMRPGDSSNPHVHHGIEVAYVLQGGSVQPPGKDPVQIPTGITSMNLRDVMHGSFKVVGDTSLKMFTVHIVDKGQPLYDYQK
jgi:hypothetical protein